MSVHDPQLLSLGAAGLLDPASERRLQEHVRECPECAAELEALSAIGSGLSAMPAPAPPPDLLARTQARLAVARERREAWQLSLAAALCAALLTAVFCIELEPYFGPLIWLAATLVPSLLGGSAVLVLASRRHAGRMSL